MPSADVTPVILTFDEEPNVRRALAGLAWAERVVVVDSFSTDRTVELARSFSNVEVFQRRFDDHTSQWSFGLAQARTPWCLTLDADYVVSRELGEEIAREVAAPRADGYFARFVYCVRGRPLRQSIMPPRLVLFRRERGSYYQDGHTQKLRLDGAAATLEAPLLHDDRKPLSRWLWAQDRYATLEAEKLLGSGWAELAWQDRVRRAMVVAPWLVPAYYLVARGGLRDGWAGLDYAAQRAIAELVLSLKLLERTRLRAGAGGAGDEP